MAAVKGKSKGHPTDYLEVLWQVRTPLHRRQFRNFNLKTLQVKCLGYVLKGQNVCVKSVWELTDVPSPTIISSR